jgi:uncharacterized protein YcnI
MYRSICFVVFSLIWLAGLPASAHVTASPNSGPAEGFFFTSFTVPHGCGGASTTSLRIKIPEGVTSVKPQLKPGWKIEIKTRKLAQPMKSESGAMLTETVDEVDWSGGPLPDNMYDTFGLMMMLPASAGQTIYFPTVQECEKGANHWINIPAAGQQWHDVREPAPFVKVLAAQ